MQEKHPLAAFHMHPNWGTKPATQACALARNQTKDLGLSDDAQPTEPHWPGLSYSALKLQCLTHDTCSKS